MAEWLRNGLQNRVPRFNSGRGLHSNFNDLDKISELAHEGQNWRWEPAGNPLCLRREPARAFSPRPAISSPRERFAASADRVIPVANS